MRLLTLSSFAVLGGALACGGSSSSEPLSAQRLAFTAQPASTYEGEPLGTVTVELRDHDGKAMSGLSSPVSLSLLNGAPLGGTTQVQAVNGVATFSDLHVDVPGAALELVATVGGAQATSAPFNAVPVVLHVTVPQDASLPGPVGAVTVSATDGVGQPISSITRAVTLSLEGGGTLGGTTTQTLQNGVATFADLSIPAAGASLMATAPAAIPGEAKTHVAYSVDEIERADLQGGPRNDTPDTAQPIAPGVPLFGSLETTGDVDVFSFPAHAGDFLAVDTFATRLVQSPWATDVQLELLDTDGSTVLWTNNNNDLDWYGNQYFDLAFDHVPIPADGTYFLRLSPDESAASGLAGGPYAVRVDLSPAPSDLQTEKEAVGTGGLNDKIADAEPLQPGWLLGWHSDATPSDFFHVTATGPTRIHGMVYAGRNGYYRANASEYDTYVYLEDSSGHAVWSNDDTHVFDSSIDFLATAPPADGYFIDIDKCCGNADQPYLFRYDATPITLTADATTNVDQPSAMAISEDEYISGAVTGSEQHWYQVNGVAGERVRVKLFSGGNLDTGVNTATVTLYDSSGAVLPSSHNQYDGYSVQTILAETGPYWIEVTSTNPTPFVFVVENHGISTWETEPNDGPIQAGVTPQANPVDANGTAAGVIDPAGDQDNFSFHADAGRLVRVAVIATEPNESIEYSYDSWGSNLLPQVSVYDANGTLLGSHDYASSRVDAESELNPLATTEVVFRAPSSGTYYATVAAEDTGFGPDHRYTLQVSYDH